MLTGRIQDAPDILLHEEILGPQFDYELQHLLPWYIWTEKVLLLDYKRMGLLREEDTAKIGTVLHSITPALLKADRKANMSDIAFAIEQYVWRQVPLEGRAHAWHVDRSRNDLQACAQLVFARDQLFLLVEELLNFFRATHALSQEHVETIMPGYTHYQAAQVISAGFFTSALSEQILSTAHQLLAVYESMDQCPLGAGAMAGQDLSWDRHRMANLLGFSRPQRHALVAVASREWRLQLAGELSHLALALSRFVTDFITWGSNEYGFIDLPDELSAISSAMPQKKNFPLLERIRGKTAHISAFYIDFLLGQRNTSYTNLVEVSKEGGTYLYTLFATVRSVLRLFTTVIERVHLRSDCMKEASEQEYLGGFTLANHLTLQEGIPYRSAQVIVGRYIVAATGQQLLQTQADGNLLRAICRDYGYTICLSDETLRVLLSADYNLRNKQSFGSTSPNSIREVLELQEKEYINTASKWREHHSLVTNAYKEVHALLNLTLEESKELNESRE